MGRWRWLFPGLKLKRWVLVLVFGIVLVVLGAIGLGLALFNPSSPESAKLHLNFYTIGGLSISIGSILVFTSVYRLVRTIEKLFRKNEKRSISELAWLTAQKEQGPKILCLGGGHGLSTLLTGLKHQPADITAVVSMADDGGSSGRLRKDFDMLPPGDIRNCLVALADAGPVMQDLMQYRFTEGEFSGHSFGNLFIMVLTQIREDFSQGIMESNRILSVQGRVLPATLDRVSLVATHADGSKTTGQRFIAECSKPISKLELKPSAGKAPDEVILRIQNAEVIIFGPGSLYTSVLPPLLEEDIAESIKKSSAIKIFIVNTMSQVGETDGFDVNSYLEAFALHAPEIKLDAVIVNSFRPGKNKLMALAEKGIELTSYSRKDLTEMPARIFLRDVIDLDNPGRHDPDKLSKAVMEVYQQLALN
ncbi:MAG: gluconeogenesis factor YvcK family protein [Planctomycetota bacterium]|jgi:uncharacterized cofD-like protein